MDWRWASLPLRGCLFGLVLPFEHIHAANVVFSSTLKVWQVPMSTHSLMSVGYAELYEKVMPHGELGGYLVAQLVEYNQKRSRQERSVEFRSLGD